MPQALTYCSNWALRLTVDGTRCRVFAILNGQRRVSLKGGQHNGLPVDSGVLHQGLQAHELGAQTQGSDLRKGLRARQGLRAQLLAQGL